MLKEKKRKTRRNRKPDRAVRKVPRKTTSLSRDVRPYSKDMQVGRRVVEHTKDTHKPKSACYL